MIRFLPAAVALSVFLSSCGYTAKARLPEDISSVAVPIFQNQTFYRDIDLELTQALRKEVLAKTNLHITDTKRAQVILDGDITDFRLVRLREDKEDEVIEFSVRLQADLELRRRNGEVIYSKKNLTRRAEFQVSLGEGLQQARAEAVREMAREIVSQVLNRW